MRQVKAAKVVLPLLASLVIIVVLYLHATLVFFPTPHAEGGTLDLSTWIQEEEGAFEITGQWEFYWDKLLSDADIKAGEEGFSLVEAPDEWNYYDLGGKNLPGEGKATYRIHVIGAEAGKEYAARIQNMASVYRLYIDDKLIAKNGSFGDGSDAPVSAYRPQFSSFVTESNNFDIILQISNDAYAVGGMWEPVIFGNYEQVLAFDKGVSFIGYFSFGSLVVMCIFLLIFFVSQRREKDMLILAGIGSMVIVRLTINGDMAVTYVFPNIPISGFGWIDYLTLLWIQFLLLYFVYCAYTGLIGRWQVTALLIYSVGVSLFVALFPFEIVAGAYKFMNIILVVVIAVVVIHLARAAYEGRAGAPALFGAISLILFLIFYEMLVDDFSLAYFLISNAAFDFSLLFFIQCFIVAGRYSRAQKTEISFLKGQIRPHFIHNALATIISISRKDTERARDLLIDFSSYLRGCYDYENDDLIPLEQELEFIRAYVALEQARFGDSLRAEYRIEAEGVRLPPLILQPLVENAFVHGLREKEDGGTVLIYAARTKSGKVRIGVRDNGVGKGTKVKNTERQGIGIENINRRLSRLYRTKLVFSVPKGGGCDVYLEIPVKEAANAPRCTY
jgi:two-component system, LytTR family, sensor kinase